MSLRDRFQYGNLENRRQLPWRHPLPALEFREDETGNTDFRGFDDQREYCVSLRVSQTFWANKAQLHQARQYAEKALVDTLYKDVLRQLSIIAGMISSGSQDEALEAVLNLRKEISDP